MAAFLHSQRLDSANLEESPYVSGDARFRYTAFVRRVHAIDPNQFPECLDDVFHSSQSILRVYEQEEFSRNDSLLLRAYYRASYPVPTVVVESLIGGALLMDSIAPGTT